MTRARRLALLALSLAIMAFLGLSRVNERVLMVDERLGWSLFAVGSAWVAMTLSDRLRRHAAPLEPENPTGVS